MATDSCTETVSGDRTTTYSVKMEWTSDDSGGTVEQAVTNLHGVIRRLVFVPGATTPTDQYDATIEDEDGADVLLGNGANLSNADVSTVAVTSAVTGKHTLKVENAGNAKTGSLIAYLTAT